MALAALDPARWQLLSPLFDEALGLPEAAQGEWLRQLAQREPELIADVEALLADHAASSRARFLAGAVAPDALAPTGEGSLAGKVLGAYTLDEIVGQGGMGSVWRAHRSDGRYRGHVAIKLLNVAFIGRTGGARFQREGRILARLAHPHIARLIDAGVTADGQPYPSSSSLAMPKSSSLTLPCASRRAR